MTIKVWSSFSCNNSSSYRLVARFGDPRAAREAAAELAAFLLEHVRQTAGRWVESEAAVELARRYGFAWNDLIEWSAQLDLGDEPQIATERDVLVLYHHYCLGFGDLPLFLQAKGGVVEPEHHAVPTVSALFRAPAVGIDPQLDAELAELFAHITAKPDRRVAPFRAPWRVSQQWGGTAAMFRDAGTVGLYFPLEPIDVPAFEHWLAARGIEHASIRWCEYADETKFVAIGSARCTACTGTLEYLDPRIHDIETPQLVCRPCGGLYDLSTFVPKP